MMPKSVSNKGKISLVGAGPGAADLLTLRALDRIRQADVICYDRLIEPEVLALADAKATLIYVGKEVGANAWPQDKICDLIVAEASIGHHVVRLKSGDPSIFGRAGEELEAARAAGIEVELIPGITAATGAAALAAQPLTERGVSDTLVIATGMCQPGASAPNWSRHAHPGTSFAFYMSVRQSPDIVANLLRAGMPSTAPITVAVEVSKPGEHLCQTTLGQLVSTLRLNKIQGSAMILATWPKPQETAISTASSRPQIPTPKSKAPLYS